MSRRRRKTSSNGNHERWLITYSDLITLLMIFFVIMYAMSKVDVAKFMTLQKSLAAALHQNDHIPLKDLGTTGLVVPANPEDQGNKKNTGTAEKATQDHSLDNLYKQVEHYIQVHHLNGNVSIENQVRGVQITLRDVVLFDTGQAVLKPQARDLLNGLIPFFKTLNNPIVIEGYTDNQPIDTAEFPSNWELSGARAANVVRYLATQISAERLSFEGYGEFHPVAPNDTDAHRQMNRRVNIVILRQDVDTSPINTPVK